MFRGLRRIIKPVIWIVAIGFVGSIFLGWGMQYSPRTRRPPEVARVNGQELSLARFERLYRGYINLYRSVLKEGFDESMSLELQQMVLEELIREKILVNEADRLGIKVGNEEIVDEIRRPFLDKDGNLDAKRFNEYIDQMARTQPGFLELREEEVKTDLKIQKLVNLIKDTVKVTDLEVREYYHKVTKEPDEKGFEASFEELKKTLLNQKTWQVYEDWYDSLREKVKIELNPNFEKLKN